MDKIIENYVKNEEIKQLDEQRLNTEALKKLLEEYFKFEIPEYIALDIIEHETYYHICLMINLATVNERISEENAATLKNGIKELFNVKNKYDTVESKIILEKRRCKKLEDKKTLEELFEQNMDNIYTMTTEKLEITKAISILEEELNKTLTDGQKELLNKINLKEAERNNIVNKNVFIFAYSLATKSIIEGLK